MYKYPGLIPLFVFYLIENHLSSQTLEARRPYAKIRALLAVTVAGDKSVFSHASCMRPLAKIRVLLAVPVAGDHMP